MFSPAYTVFCAISMIRAPKAVDRYHKLISEFSAQIIYIGIIFFLWITYQSSFSDS